MPRWARAPSWLRRSLFAAIVAAALFQERMVRLLGNAPSQYFNAPEPEGENAGKKLSSKFAYVFLIAGCDPYKPEKYRGYIYNVMAAAHVLSSGGSTQDIVVMVRMGAKSNLTKLPDQEERWLTKPGARIKYLAKHDDERSDSFYTATLDKLQVLGLFEYERVLFMDSDAIPLCNLDNFLELAVGNTTRSNLAIAWKTEPTNSGFFVVQPGKEALDEVNAIIRRQERSEYAKTLWPPFEPVEGWGAKLEWPWRSILGNGSKLWHFYGAFGSQGLLYMIYKFAFRDVSIVVHHEVDHIYPGDNSSDTHSVRVEKSPTEETVDPYSCSKADKLNRGKFYKHAPYRDFHHFTGESKPWLGRYKDAPEIKSSASLKSTDDARNPRMLWLAALRLQVRRLNLTSEIDVDNFVKDMKRPPLGLYPTYPSVKSHTDALASVTTEGKER